MRKEKLRRGTFLHIESELYSYHETRKEIISLQNDILYGRESGDENIGGGRGNLPGDPTGKRAVLLATHKRLEQLQRIVDAIESVVERLPEDKQKMVRLRYWTKSKALTWEGIASEIPVHRATALRWRDEIVKAIADRLGWR